MKRGFLSGGGSSSAIAANTKGFVDATTDNTLPRPVGFASIEWMILTTQEPPVNMAANDTLVVV